MKTRAIRLVMGAIAILAAGSIAGAAAGATPAAGGGAPPALGSDATGPPRERRPTDSGQADSAAAAVGLPDSMAPGPDSTSANADSLPGRHSAIAVGERLVFTVRYGMIKAGTAVMEVVDRKKVGGRPAYHVVSTASTNSVFDGIYRVRDRVVSLLDEDHLYSLYFEKHLREGRYRADQQVKFDHERAVAVYHDGREAVITPGTFDALAAFYRVRTMPLEPGQRFFLESHDNRKNYPLRVTVLRRETVETPAGTFACLVVEPTLRSGAFFKNEGRLSIWLTDDDRRMPVLMRSKLPIGAISVELIEFQRPPRSGAPAPSPTASDAQDGRPPDDVPAGDVGH